MNQEENNNSLTLITNATDLFYYRHNNPEISYCFRVPKRSITAIPHIIKPIKKSDNIYIIKINEIKTKICESPNNKEVNLFLTDLFFIKNKEKIYPQKIRVNYSGAIFEYYGQFMDAHIAKYGRFFLTPLFLTSDIEITMEDENISEMYCSFLSQTSNYLSNVFNHEYWSTSKVIVIFHELISDITNVNGYYSRLFISSDNWNNVKSISLKRNTTYLLEEVSPLIMDIKKGIMYIPLCLDEKVCEHGIQIKPSFHFSFYYELHDDKLNTKITLYGEKHGLISNL